MKSSRLSLIVDDLQSADEMIDELLSPTELNRSAVRTSSPMVQPPSPGLDLGHLEQGISKSPSF
jgi:hypothetical protein